MGDERRGSMWPARNPRGPQSQSPPMCSHRSLRVLKLKTKFHGEPLDNIRENSLTMIFKAARTARHIDLGQQFLRLSPSQKTASERPKSLHKSSMTFVIKSASCSSCSEPWMPPYAMARSHAKSSAFGQKGGASSSHPGARTSQA